MYGITVNRASDLSITKQLYQQIRQNILNGHLREGDSLPATRKFASQLSISRNIVLEVYDQLRIEGFIESRQGSYTSVAAGTFLTQLPSKFSAENQFDTSPPSDMINFRYGIPALDHFPRKEWKKALAQTILDVPVSYFDYNDIAGCLNLRTAIATYLFKTRGIVCSPKQIIVTSGSTQAFTLITQLLLSHNRKVIIEDPLNIQLQRYLSSLGCQFVPIPIDEQGLQTDYLLKQSISPPDFILVTPSHQFPTGGILPIQRRIQVIRFARKTNSYIVEDDYENEFTYEGSPISSLQELAPEQVIYVGTFSKTLIPTLRLGYIILPNTLMEKFYKLDWYATQQPSAIDQLALASFINSGQFERHVAKMNKIYQKRRNRVMLELNRHFTNNVKILSNSAGLHLTAQFKAIKFSSQLLSHILHYGVQIYSAHQHVIDKNNTSLLNQAILGYGNLNENEIVEGIQRLKAALNNMD